MKLKIVLENGMDGYITAYCPALKGCVTQGRTEEEAVKNLKEAIELYLEVDPADIALPKDQYKVSELTRETGISQRMIAYYEKQAKYPPTHLLPTLAKALGTSGDELLGIKKTDVKMNKKICGSGGDSLK